VVLDHHLDAGQAAGQRDALHLAEAQGRRQGGDPQQMVGLRGADDADQLRRRVPDPPARIDAAQLHLAELRVLEAAPGHQDPAVVLVAVPPGQLDQLVAAELLVVVDELLGARHAEPREQVPQLHHVGEGAALVVGVVGQVAVQGLVGLVGELLEARHHRVAGELLGPGAHLLEDLEVLLVELGVGGVAERADEDAAEGVEVEPGEDLRVARGELDDGARLGLRGRVGAGADLLVTRRPRPGEVAVEIDGVVADEDRGGHGVAVPGLDRPLRVDLVEGPLVVEAARHQQAGEARRLDQLAGGIDDAHHQRQAVAVDVTGLPARRAAIRPLVAGHRADVAAGAQHGLGPVGAHPRHHVEEDLPEALEHRRREVVGRRLGVQPQDVLGDRQGHARAAQLAGVHVAVDPDRRPDPLGIAADRQEPQLASLGRRAQALQAAQRREGLGPAPQLRGQLGVVEVAGAEALVERVDGRRHRRRCYVRARRSSSARRSDRTGCAPARRWAARSPAARPSPASSR
jgi:hypothetical protein